MSDSVAVTQETLSRIVSLSLTFRCGINEHLIHRNMVVQVHTPRQDDGAK